MPNEVEVPVCELLQQAAKISTASQQCWNQRLFGAAKHPGSGTALTWRKAMPSS